MIAPDLPEIHHRRSPLTGVSPLTIEAPVNDLLEARLHTALFFGFATDVHRCAEVLWQDNFHFLCWFRFAMPCRSLAK